MPISTEIDLLITNMITFSRLDASYPIKVAENVKIEKKYIDIAMSVLVCLYEHTRFFHKSNFFKNTRLRFPQD